MLNRVENNIRYIQENRAGDPKEVKQTFKTDKTASDKVSVNSGRNISFKGGSPLVDGVTAIIQFIENGGKAVEFTVIDLFSMILPRTFQAFGRNREELGHPNYKAGTEEAIREFLTGPSMFIIPMGFLAASKKLFGDASRSSFSVLHEFGRVLKDTATYDVNTNSENLKTNFYKRIFSEALQQHKDHLISTGQSAQKVDDAVKYLVENLPELEKAQANLESAGKSLRLSQKLVGDFATATNKALALVHKVIKGDPGDLVQISTPKAYSEYVGIRENAGRIKKEIVQTVENLSANHNISNIEDFRIIKSGNWLGKGTAMTFEDLINNLLVYKSDVLKDLGQRLNEGYMKTVAGENPLLQKAEQLIRERKGGRTLTILAAIITTGSFLYSIPLLYKRNRQYPGIDGLVKENLSELSKEINTTAQNAVNTVNTAGNTAYKLSNNLVDSYIYARKGGAK